MKTSNLPGDAQYTGDQRLWLSGFLAGFDSAAAGANRDDVLATALEALRELDTVAAPEVAPADESPGVSDKPKRSPWTRKNPYPAKLVANRPLRGAQSGKDVRHVVFDLGDSAIDYEAGDGLGIRPVNDPDLVAALIARIGADPEESITTRTGESTLLDLLTYDYEISLPTRELIDHVADRTGDAELVHVLSTEEREALEGWLWGKDVLDLLDLDPNLEMTASQLLELLRPLAHRVYSISSSPLTHQGMVHLTVAAVRHRSAQRDRRGQCSTYLADRVGAGNTAGVFLSKNRSFRLPADDAAPVIMVGPGTGIAPFRSFLYERKARKATGTNWLFFGDQYRATDFMYEDELVQFQRDGVLHRLDLAFSRDQEQKIYVQDRMREHGEELFRWIEGGAYFYVCGDAAQMARDVDSALHDVIAEHGGLGEEAAEDYVNTLKREKRYLRDVY
ncbi:sulfite reductase (NADPH) flavoprotein alpha-component [Williamsia limnetica]|uniref:assimilatory sulfite reductase (NADPH) n=1 Tax=Williamsia limnetica TaxID=882452 RepID=A0A318RJF4_WILLI|nr:sulfite reductase subunit alpha [Williamsia limnetica]PYE15409.1 sulfite reductase (NADPH) flavoprotein alpha-component [Williamsia limnetica]